MEALLKHLRDSSRYQRRRRHAPRQPDTLRSTVVNDRDVEILTFIHLHGGMLTTDIIFQYAKTNGLYQNHASLSRRLKELYHDAGVLDRPVGQRQIAHPERYPLVHRVSEKGELALKARNRLSAYAPRPWGPYRHNMLNACVYASYALNAQDAGITLTPVDNRRVKPDTLFMLTINGKHVLVFLEIDRATESGHADDDKRKSWGRSVKEYQQIIGEKRYKQHYDVPATCGAQVHVVTTQFAMQQKILREIERVFPQGCPYILTHTCGEAGEETHPVPYLNMLGVAWARHGHGTFQYLKRG
jgi:hypothetical protein